MIAPMLVRPALVASAVALALAAGLSHVAAQQVESRLEIFNIATGDRSVVHRAPVRFEAPNWFPHPSPDGRWIVFL